MRHLVDVLDITVPAGTWPSLMHAATFDRMRARATRVVPDPAGILRDPAAFFRQGASGTGATVLTQAQLEHYHQRTATLAPPDLRSWFHRSVPIPRHRSM